MLDVVNIEILNLLQQNARMSASEIASEVRLSVPAVAERIKKLVDLRYVKNFVAILNAKNMSYDVTAFIIVDCTSSDLYDHVVKKSIRNKSIL